MVTFSLGKILLGSRGGLKNSGFHRLMSSGYLTLYSSAIADRESPLTTRWWQGRLEPPASQRSDGLLAAANSSASTCSVRVAVLSSGMTDVLLRTSCHAG